MTTYNVDRIADYFRSLSNPEFGDLLSNLKLQKLCYYAAGIIAAVRNDDNDPLFRQQIEAWQHGPVVPSEYRRFRDYGSGNIPAVEGEDFSDIDARDRAILDDVFNFYGQYSAWKLRNMTHEERPWIDSFASDDKRITNRQLREYFADEVTPAYIASYNEAR